MRQRPASTNQPLRDEDLASYTAARAFSGSAFLGSCIMVASFTMLYIGSFVLGIRAFVSITIGVLLLALGAVVYLKSKRIWVSLEYPFRRRLVVLSDLFALSALIFWLLFVILISLTGLGEELLPR